MVDFAAVIPLVPAAAGHFNTSAIQDDPDWWAIHQYHYYVNIATSGSPDWWPCCSRQE
jgi:hypothetical protein